MKVKKKRKKKGEEKKKVFVEMSKVTGLQGRRKQRLAQVSPVGKEIPEPEPESESDEFELDESGVINHTKKELPLIEKVCPLWLHLTARFFSHFFSLFPR